MDFGSTFYNYCKLKNIGSVEKNEFLINKEEFKTLCNLNVIHDGRTGGLVLGKLHCKGGIHLIQPYSEDKLKYVGEMEGWEFLSSPVKNNEIGSKFEFINKLNVNYDRNSDTSFDIPQNRSIIDTRNSEIGIILLSANSQFIGNRLSTKIFINELINLELENQKYI